VWQAFDEAAYTVQILKLSSSSSTSHSGLINSVNNSESHGDLQIDNAKLDNMGNGNYDLTLSG